MATSALTSEKTHLSSVVNAMSRRVEMIPLPPLPGDDLYVFRKTIDNSRLTPRPLPKRGPQSAKLFVVFIVSLLVVVFLYNARSLNYKLGYQLESLKEEKAKLLEQWQLAELEEASLVGPERLQATASNASLQTVAAARIIHLNPADENALAYLRQSQAQIRAR